MVWRLLSRVTAHCLYCTDQMARWVNVMEQSIQKGSVLDDYSCNDKDLWEVKLMTERERSTSGLK